MWKTTSESKYSGALDSIVILALSLLTACASIGIQSALARLLGPEGRGEYGVCITFASLIGIAFSFGTDRAVQYYVMAGRLSARYGLRLMSTIVLLSSTIAIAAGWAMVNSTLPLFTKADRSAFIVALGLVPILSEVSAVSLLLSGLRKFAIKGFAELLDLGGRLLFLLVFVAGLGGGVTGALVAVVAGGVLALAFQVVGIRKNEGVVAPVGSSNVWADILSYGARYYPARLGNNLNVHMGVLVLAFVSTRAEVGYFAVAQSLMTRILMIPESISTALLPRVGACKSGRPGLVSQACRVSTFIVAICLAMVLAISQFLVPLLFSENFGAVVPLLWIMAPGILFRTASKALMSYFMGVNRPGIVSVATAAGLLLNILVLPPLYYRIGLPAAAWMATGGNALSLAILMGTYTRYSRQSIIATLIIQYGDIMLVKEMACAFLRNIGIRNTER